MLRMTATCLFERLLEVHKSCPIEPDQTYKDLLVADVSRDLKAIIDSLSALKTPLDSSSSLEREKAPLQGNEVVGALSMDHLRAVYTSIELLWRIALKPIIAQHVPGFKEDNLSYPKTLVFKQGTMDTLAAPEGISSSPSMLEAWALNRLVFDVIFVPTFSMTMQKRFIKRVLIFLLLAIHMNEGSVPVTLHCYSVFVHKHCT